jgi:hypothetical protein
MNISGYVHGLPVKFGHVDVDFAQWLPTPHLYVAIKIVWTTSVICTFLKYELRLLMLVVLHVSIEM